MGYAVKLQKGVVFQKATLKYRAIQLNGVPIHEVVYDGKTLFVAKHCIVWWPLNAAYSQVKVVSINTTIINKTTTDVDSSANYGNYGASFSIFDNDNVVCASPIDTTYHPSIIATTYDMEYHNVKYNTNTNPYTFTRDWNYVYIIKTTTAYSGAYLPTLNGNDITGGWSTSGATSSNRGCGERLLTSIKAGDVIAAKSSYSSMLLICFDEL